MQSSLISGSRHNKAGGAGEADVTTRERERGQQQSCRGGRAITFGGHRVLLRIRFLASAFVDSAGIADTNTLAAILVIPARRHGTQAAARGSSPPKPRGARKSGVGVAAAAAAAAARTARKAVTQASDDESSSDTSPIIKSTSGSNPRTESGAAGGGRRDEDEDIENSLLQPARAKQAAGVPNSVIRSKASRDAPDSKAKSVTAGGGKGKTSGKGKSKYYERRQTSEDTDNPNESSPNVSSRSRSGGGGRGAVYQWDCETLGIEAEDIGQKLSYHNSITTELRREGKEEKVRFRRGDKLWILPDPEWLPPSSRDVDIKELDDDLWWVGEVLDCCALDQTSQANESNLGLLRICWYYTPDQVQDLKNVHQDYKKRMRRYRFEDNERVRSDHVDFVGIECFAGFADGVETFLSVHGLEIDDKERIKRQLATSRKERSREIPCRSKAGVRVEGFTLKGTILRTSQTTRVTNSRTRKRRHEEEE